MGGNGVNMNGDFAKRMMGGIPGDLSDAAYEVSARTLETFADAIEHMPFSSNSAEALEGARLMASKLADAARNTANIIRAKKRQQ